MAQSVAVPGDLLGNSKEFQAGIGVMQVKNEIRATLLGKIVIEEPENGKGKRKINVVAASGVPAQNFVPRVGDIVTGRVTRTNYNQAYVEVFCIGDTELAIPIKAVIRREDIRDFEIDKVVVSEFFKSNDILKAIVTSLGDNKTYFLSTSKQGSGVILSTLKSENLK